MKTVLVIFEEVPEITKLIILNVNKGELDNFKRWNGHYVNSTETPDDIAGEINEYFYPNFGNFRFEDQVVKGFMVDVHFDLVVRMGFYL